MALGTTEMLIIGGIVILLFGAPKVITWARSLGEAKREFAKAQEEPKTDTKES